ncbi:hypothetical protein D9M71_691580 [compost metagenome]
MPALHPELRLAPQLEHPVAQPTVLGRGLQPLMPHHPIPLRMLDKPQGPPGQVVQPAQLPGDVLGDGGQCLAVGNHLHRGGEERHLQAHPPLQALGAQVAVDEAVLVTTTGNTHMLVRQVVGLAERVVSGQRVVVAHQAHRAVLAQ